MTRVTNFGIKRTHVQAGFSQDEPEPAPQPTAGTSAAPESDKQEENKTPRILRRRRRESARRSLSGMGTPRRGLQKLRL